MKTHCALAALLSVLVAPSAQAAPERAAVQANLRAQVGSGRISLDVEGLPFGAFLLAEAEETPAGHFRGRTAFGPLQARALLHFVPKGKDSEDGTWLLALRLPVSRLASLAPGVQHTVVDPFALSEPTLVFAVSPVSAKRDLLGPEVAVKGTGKVAAGAGRVTAWSAKHHGQLVMLDAASFKAQLARYRSGNKVALTLQVRFLGERRTVALRANAADIGTGRVFSDLWTALKRTL